MRKKSKLFFHLVIIYIPFRILVFFLKLMPFFLIPKLSEIIRFVVLSTMRKTRNRVIKNIEIAFGDKYSYKEKKEICKELFKNIILNFLELDQLTKIKKEKIRNMVEIEGENILNEVLKKEKGVVAICAHLGNFPIAQTILSMKGYPINMIVRDTNNRYLARYAENWLRKMKVSAISKWNLKKALEESKKWLNKKGILCIYIDQHARNGVKCNFFGKSVYIPIGAAVFARKYDSPVIGIFIFKTGLNKHRIIIEGPYEIKKTKNISEDIKENTSFFIKRVEYYVEKYPEQWFSWLHRMFR
ncbi:MAG: lysophospholipid acyltransferase family protein [Candidatus Omnitrophica bacterium]|nr:lysophospholipid acyltransferase family protein [Candidatus Omnitrophota bacterium]